MFNLFSPRTNQWMVMVSVLGLTLVAENLDAQTNLDWDSLRGTFALYSKDPSEQNATKICQLLPNSLGYSASPAARRNYLDTSKFILNHLGPLESQMFKSRPNAVALAFRFYTIADGEFAESLDVILGKLICRNPRLFLQELKANRRFVSRLEAVLMNYGPDFADNESDQEKEYHRRLKSLRKVRDPELRDIRDECVEFMEENP